MYFKESVWIFVIQIRKLLIWVNGIVAFARKHKLPRIQAQGRALPSLPHTPRISAEGWDYADNYSV